MTSLSLSFFLRAASLAFSAAFLVSCNKSETPANEGHEAIDAVVELLHHDDKGLTVAQSVTLDHLGQSFELAGTQLRILEHWEQAQALPETDNEGDKENHAVELGWNISAADTSPAKESQWIYQTIEDGPSGLLPGIDIQVRILPPGSQPSPPDQWKNAAKDTVQFEHEKHFVSVPKAGDEIFPGWKVEKIHTYQHALLEENGDIKESDDGNFDNRAIEIILTSDEGTVERHLCFLDHPELTKGIHPSLLPATRLKGSNASQSRLTARDPIKIQGNSKNRLLLSADGKDPAKLTAFTWDDKNSQFTIIPIASLPAEVKVGEQSISILQHRNHARSVVKWQRISRESKNDESSKEEDKITSALLITWLENNHHQKAVLPLDRPTPVRIKGQFQTFRYRGGKSSK